MWLPQFPTGSFTSCLFFSFTWSHFAHLHDLFDIYRHLHFQLLDCGLKSSSLPLCIKTIWLLLTFLGSFLVFSLLELYTPKIQFPLRRCVILPFVGLSIYLKSLPLLPKYFFLLENVFLISLELTVPSGFFFSLSIEHTSMLDYLTTLYFTYLCKIRRNFLLWAAGIKFLVGRPKPLKKGGWAFSAEPPGLRRELSQDSEN